MAEASTTATASVQTAHGSRYLQQLCKHFQHKVPVSFDPVQGEIVFPQGTCTLRADAAGLHLSVTAGDAAACAQVQDVAARHLVRFAFREPLAVSWHAAG